jgi:hypothetical protein
MVTAYSQNEIDAKAKATADLILQALFEPGLLEPACEAYQHVRGELFRRGLESADVADAPNDSSIKRLLFEMIAFAAFIIMGQELPQWLRRKSPLGEEEPDVEWIRYYNTQFLNRVAHHLESSEFTQLREVTLISTQPALQFGDGEPLSVVRRVSGYVRVGSAAEAAKYFSQFAALAMDPHHYAVLTPITFRLVESVVGVARIVLRGVFARKLT